MLAGLQWEAPCWLVLLWILVYCVGLQCDMRISCGYGVILC